MVMPGFDHAGVCRRNIDLTESDKLRVVGTKNLEEPAPLVGMHEELTDTGADN